MAVSKKHRNGCVCAACDPRAYPCKFTDCAHESTGKLQAGWHEASHRRRKRQRRIILQPDGLGFLRRIVTEKKLADAMDLRGLTRFQSMLLGGTSPANAPAPRKRGWRYTKIDKIAMDHYASISPTAHVNLFGAHTTANAAFTVYRLALLAGVSPKSVVGALLTYGMEYLAQELRTSRRASVPAARSFEAPPREHAAMIPQAQAAPAQKTTAFYPTGR